MTYSFTIAMGDDGFERTVPMTAFFEAARFSDLEARALDLSQGNVLDIGAAAGRHSLELHRRGLSVWSMDILPESQRIISERGLPHPLIGDIFVLGGMLLRQAVLFGGDEWDWNGGHPAAARRVLAPCTSLCILARANPLRFHRCLRDREPGPRCLPREKY